MIEMNMNEIEIITKYILDCTFGIY